jgi:hypothetical protein
MKTKILLNAFTLIILVMAGTASRSSAEEFIAPGETVTVQAPTRFSSAYTALTKCGSGMTKKQEKEAEEHGSDIPTRCKGPGGYDIFIGYSACASDIAVVKGEERIPLAMQAVDWKQKTVEWRMAQVKGSAKPFAIIMRVYEYGGNDQCAAGGKITGEFLVIKGLKGYEHINEKINVKSTPNPNFKAREIADKGYKMKDES